MELFVVDSVCRTSNVSFYCIMPTRGIGIERTVQI